MNPFVFKILMVCTVLFPMITLQSQNFSNNFETHWLLDFNASNKLESNVFEAPYESPKSFRALNFSDTNYVMNLFSMESKRLNFCLKFRLEDELPYENNIYDYSGFHYFDFELNYSAKAFNFSVGLENLLGLNNANVNIQPELVKQTEVYNEVIFVYDSAYLINAGISFNF